MPDHEILTARSDTATGHVATYRRVLPVSLERMYENTLDWEHLPHVHADSFSSITCLDAGSWGWRAEVADARGVSSVIELTLDRSVRRWITRNLQGPNKGAEIWTHVFPVEPQRLEIVVDFFVPGVSAESRDKVGAAYAGLYSRLYDEDVAMMVERQRALDTRIEAGARSADLGLRSQLQLPMTVTLGSREFVIASVDDELVGFPSLCPHQLGPLDASALDGVSVTCPWHGYRFDVRSGECISGQACRMQSLVFSEQDGRVTVSTTH
jgi:nitrite reductase/ring-hydroxylating ferredoxin subunit